MIETLYSCPGCNAPLSPQLFDADDSVYCEKCNTRQRQLAFPVLWQPPQSLEPAEKIVSDEEARCAFHEDNRAAVPCSQCGRYLCSICTLILEGSTYCPACIESIMASNRQNSETSPYKNEQRRYDLIIFYLALLPILTIWLPLITAPIAFFLGLYWIPRVRKIEECSLRILIGSLLFAVVQALVVLVGIASVLISLATII